MPRRSTPRLKEFDYLTLLGAVHAIVWRADARTFRTTFASRGAEDVLGYPLSSWTSVPGFWVEHLHPDDRKWVLAFTGGETQAGHSHDFEYRMIAADGRVVWLRNIVNVIVVEGKPVELVGVTVDITARKRAELEADELKQELTRVARASALGEMATVLAHELNQPLSAVVSNAETAQLLAERGPAAMDQLRSVLEDVRQDAQRAGDILHRVHAFLQRKHLERHQLDALALIQGVMRTMRSILAARRVECTVDVAPLLPPISGDAVQIQQVLVNLIRNAIEAMSALTSERRLTVRAVAAGDAVELSVSDNGSGISPEMLPRLFEPFATNKVGGLGMGLAISRRIVEAHGGQIRALANADGGVTVSFTIPIDGAAGDTS